MKKADKITMILRILLLSILLSPLLTSAEVKRPSYCEVLDKMYDYDFRKELAKNKDQVFQNCVGIDNQVITFDDLLDNAYSINKAVHQQESIEFKHKLRDTLVKKNYESMLKYTNIPGLSLSAEHTNGITSCLGFDNTKLNLKDEEGATETFVYRNFQLAYQAKGIIHTLKKARDEFNTVTEKYLEFKAQEFREQRLNRTGVVDKNSVFNLHVRKTFEKAKREYEKKVSFHQAKLFRLVKSEPWLFDVGRNWSPSNFLDKEIKLSSIGERFVSKMPKNLELRSRSVNTKNFSDVFTENKDDVSSHIKKLVNNSTFKSDLLEDVQEHIDEVSEDNHELCKKDGQRLHNFPQLVKEVMTNMTLDPRTKKIDLLKSQASYCKLLKEEPLDKQGLDDVWTDTALYSLGGGAVLLGIGAVVFTPAAILGTGVLLASGAIFVADTGIQGFNEYKLLDENELVHTAGWSEFNEYVDNGEAVLKTAGLELVYSSTLAVKPVQWIIKHRNKIQEFEKNYKKNLERVDRNEPDEYVEILYRSHDETIDEAITDPKQVRVLKKLEWYQGLNRANVFPTLYRDDGLSKIIKGIKEDKGGSTFDEVTDNTMKELSKLKNHKDFGVGFDFEDTNLANAYIANERKKILDRIRPKNISEEKPLVIELPRLKDDSIIDQSERYEFSSVEEYYSFKDKVLKDFEDAVFNHAKSKKELSEELQDGFSEVKFYSSYRDDLKEISYKGKTALQRRRKAEYALEKNPNPTEQNPLEFYAPYVKDGKMVYPKDDDNYKIVITNRNDAEDYIENRQVEYDQSFAISRKQALEASSGLSKRFTNQAKSRRKLIELRNELRKVPKIERSFSQEKMLREIEEALSNPKLFPRDKEREKLQLLELYTEQAELSRRIVNKTTFGLLGRRKDDPAGFFQKLKALAGSSVVVALGGMYVYNRISFEIDDIISSGDVGEARAIFNKFLDLKLRTVFGASDKEKQCASEFRGFSFGEACAIPLLKEYLVIELAKRKRNPDYDLVNDEVAVRKTLDYLKYLFDIRNFRGDAAIHELFDTHKHQAATRTSAEILTRILSQINIVTGEEISLAERIILESDKKVVEEKLADLAISNPELASLVKETKDLDFASQIIEYGDLPASLKSDFRKLIDKAIEEDPELSVLKASQEGKVLVSPTRFK